MSEHTTQAAHIIVVALPLLIVSVANLREHWSVRAKRARLHRSTTSALLRRHRAPVGHVTVTLTRIAARQLDDDNLVSALKNCRDGVADWLEVNDNDPRVAWAYAQRRGKTMSAEVVVEGRP